MRNQGVWLSIFLCCGWPLVVYGTIEYIKAAIKRRDWSSVQWSEIRWPWSKEQ